MHSSLLQPSIDFQFTLSQSLKMFLPHGVLSFLSLPFLFLIPGDFSINVSDPSNALASQFHDLQSYLSHQLSHLFPQHILSFIINNCNPSIISVSSIPPWPIPHSLWYPDNNNYFTPLRPPIQRLYSFFSITSLIPTNISSLSSTLGLEYMVHYYLQLS